MASKLPSLHQYITAINNPHVSLSDSQLKHGRAVFRTTKGGRKQIETHAGQFALTVRFQVDQNEWAIRCFTNVIPNDLHKRYSEVTTFIANTPSEFFVNIEYQPKGILVDGQWWPICKMEWVRGTTLNLYIEENLSKPVRMSMLPSKFLELGMALENLGCAHGDLQHGNIMAQSDQLRLVDYDGMYVPSYENLTLQATETGHRNYQHPQRDTSHFDQNIDRFSAISIYLSLKILDKDASQYPKDGESLFFSREDYLDPEKSVKIQLIEQLGYTNAAHHFRRICSGDIGQIPSLPEFILMDPQLQVELPESVQKALGADQVIRVTSTSPANKQSVSNDPTPEPPAIPLSFNVEASKDANETQSTNSTTQSQSSHKTTSGSFTPLKDDDVVSTKPVFVPSSKPPPPAKSDESEDEEESPSVSKPTKKSRIRLTRVVVLVLLITVALVVLVVTVDDDVADSFANIATEIASSLGGEEFQTPQPNTNGETPEEMTVVADPTATPNNLIGINQTRIAGTQTAESVLSGEATPTATRTQIQTRTVATEPIETGTLTPTATSTPRLPTLTLTTLPTSTQVPTLGRTHPDLETLVTSNSIPSPIWKTALNSPENIRISVKSWLIRGHKVSNFR